MDTRGFQQYKEQSISTMTQGELLVLLYDELVKRVTRAEIALEKQDYTLLDSSVERSKDILRYLDDTLDRRYPISMKLSRLYEYFSYQLCRVQIGRNKTVLQEIKPMICDLRDSFRTAEKTAVVPEVPENTDTATAGAPGAADTADTAVAAGTAGA